MITHYQVGYISKNIVIVCFVLILNASFNLIFYLLNFCNPLWLLFYCLLLAVYRCYLFLSALKTLFNGIFNNHFKYQF